MGVSYLMTKFSWDSCVAGIHYPVSNPPYPNAKINFFLPSKFYFTNRSKRTVCKLYIQFHFTNRSKRTVCKLYIMFYFTNRSKRTVCKLLSFILQKGVRTHLL